ncbi:MAG: hypothetical protein OXM55_08110 [Bdellovibrionales bacterium]|nr:hypothetical protein [Bdellovibrionales bacterium]
MKGLSKIPGEKSISKAYKALQFSSGSVYVKDLVLWSQWTRLDPRLGEIFVGHISKFWRTYNPVDINQKLKQQIWPAVFGVILEQVPFYYLQNKKTKYWNKKLFLNWSKCVMTDILPAQNEQFFIGIYKAGGKLMKEECLYAIKPYRQWGYYSKDLLINKAQISKKTLLSISQRNTIIDELLKLHKRIRVKDYLEKGNFQIHRRQAQRDLKNYKRLKPCGHTKGKYYILSHSKSKCF